MQLFYYWCKLLVFKIKKFQINFVNITLLANTSTSLKFNLSLKSTEVVTVSLEYFSLWSPAHSSDCS